MQCALVFTSPPSIWHFSALVISMQFFGNSGVWFLRGATQYEVSLLQLQVGVCGPGLQRGIKLLHPGHIQVTVDYCG